MKILALESSAKPLSAAVFDNDRLRGADFKICGLSHSRTLLPMVQNLLDSLSISLGDIDVIAVAIGPGSFTGIRIGVSAAKGLAFGLDIPICAVSTLLAMAYAAESFETEPGNSIICPVMDARNNQVYNALFEYSGGKISRLCEDRALSLDELLTDLKSRTFTSKGNASNRRNVLLVGDGALITNDYFLQNNYDNIILPPEFSRYQTARGVAVASIHTTPVSASEIIPSYIRIPQAERERGFKKHT